MITFANPAPFVNVPLGDMPKALNDNIDGMLANDDQLAKQGRVGKWASKNRPRFVCILVAIAMIGVGTCIYAVFGFFGWFWGLAAGQTHGLFQSTLQTDTVKLSNGLLVERVVEPRAVISGRNHALLLYEQLKTAEPLTRNKVMLGYSQWIASQAEGRHNFTFQGAKTLAQKHTSETNVPCVCFYELGLPTNAVYFKGEVFFEPVCEDKHGSPVVTIEGVKRGSLYTLYQDVVQFMNTDNDARLARYKPLISTKSGIVDYISEKSGARARKILDEDEKSYTCVKNCLFLQE